MRSTLSALFVLSLASTALADPPPVALSVAPVATQQAWRWTLTNTTSSPLEVLTDRRLVWIEQTQPPPLPNGRVRRLRTLARCVHSARPTTHERAARTTLAPGQQYSEDVLLHDLCGVNLPRWVTAGAPITLHYGFNVARRGRPSLLRTLVLDERTTPVNDLTAITNLPALAAENTAPAGVSGAPTLTARGTQAALPEDLRITVRFHNTSVHPMVLPWRATMFRFEVRGPSGRQVECRALTRGFGAQREYFVRVAGRGSLSMTLLPALYCPQGALATPGLYDVTTVFNNTLDGREYGLQRVFTGTLRSPASMLRVTRGNGRFLPLRPEVSPAR